MLGSLFRQGSSELCQHCFAAVWAIARLFRIYDWMNHCGMPSTSLGSSLLYVTDPVLQASTEKKEKVLRCLVNGLLCLTFYIERSNAFLGLLTTGF